MFSTKQRAAADNVVRIHFSSANRTSGTNFNQPTYTVPESINFMSLFDDKRPVYVALENFNHNPSVTQTSTLSGTNYNVQGVTPTPPYTQGTPSGDNTVTFTASSNYVTTGLATHQRAVATTTQTQTNQIIVMTWENMPSLGRVFGTAGFLTRALAVFGWNAFNKTVFSTLANDTMGIPLSLGQLQATRTWGFRFLQPDGTVHTSPTINEHVFTLVFFQKPTDASASNHIL